MPFTLAVIEDAAFLETLTGKSLTYMNNRYTNDIRPGFVKKAHRNHVEVSTDPEGKIWERRVLWADILSLDGGPWERDDSDAWGDIPPNTVIRWKSKYDAFDSNTRNGAEYVFLGWVRPSYHGDNLAMLLPFDSGTTGVFITRLRDYDFEIVPLTQAKPRK